MSGGAGELAANTVRAMYVNCTTPAQPCPVAQLARLSPHCLPCCSGRKRAKGEMNGKSANINTAARQIYPDGHGDIPLSEVLCIFDADQVG